MQSVTYIHESPLQDFLLTAINEKKFDKIDELLHDYVLQKHKKINPVQKKLQPLRELLSEADIKKEIFEYLISKNEQYLNYFDYCAITNNYQAFRHILSLTQAHPKKSNDFIDSNGFSPIHHAICHRSYEFLENLFDNSRNKYLPSAVIGNKNNLHLANSPNMLSPYPERISSAKMQSKIAQENELENRKKVAKLLLKEFPEMMEIPDRAGLNPQHYLYFYEAPDYIKFFEKELLDLEDFTSISSAEKSQQIQRRFNDPHIYRQIAVEDRLELIKLIGDQQEIKKFFDNLSPEILLEKDHNQKNLFDYAIKNGDIEIISIIAKKIDLKVLQETKKNLIVKATASLAFDNQPTQSLIESRENYQQPEIAQQVGRRLEISEGSRENLVISVSAELAFDNQPAQSLHESRENHEENLKQFEGQRKIFNELDKIYQKRVKKESPTCFPSQVKILKKLKELIDFKWRN